MKATLLHHINVQITNRDRTREWYCRVLGATVLDRGPALNKRQLQLNIGQAELHFSDVKRVTATHPRVHFALEVEDWDEMLTSLDAQGIEYTRDAGGAFSRAVLAVGAVRPAPVVVGGEVVVRQLMSATLSTDGLVGTWDGPNPKNSFRANFGNC